MIKGGVSSFLFFFVRFILWWWVDSKVLGVVNYVVECVEFGLINDSILVVEEYFFVVIKWVDNYCVCVFKFDLEDRVFVLVLLFFVSICVIFIKF